MSDIVTYTIDSDVEILRAGKWVRTKFDDIKPGDTFRAVFHSNSAPRGEIHIGWEIVSKEGHLIDRGER